jgi:hypothetical protein
MIEEMDESPQENNLISEAILLDEIGGRCDCEMIFNVQGNWLED